MWIWHTAERGRRLSMCPFTATPLLAWSDARFLEMFLSCVKLRSWMGRGWARWVQLTSGSRRDNGGQASMGRTKNRGPCAYGPCCGRGFGSGRPFWKEEALKCPCIRGDVWISIQALVGQVVAAWCCKFLSVRSPLRIYITPTQPHSLMLKAFFLCLYQKMMMCDMKSVLMP